MTGGDDQKGRQLFEEKIGLTPRVAAPGDTNPSDASTATPHSRVVTMFLGPQVFKIRRSFLAPGTLTFILDTHLDITEMLSAKMKSAG